MPLSSRAPLDQNGPQSGFSLVEVLLAVVVIVLASGAAVSSLVASRNLNEVADERAIAREALDSRIEEMKSRAFNELFALYNDDPVDDPAGPAAPGSGFAAGPLTAQPGDPDGLPGEVIFPLVGGVLREDAVDAALGMPRDLDFDGDVDAGDRSGDYAILPVTLRIAWRGVKGDSELTQHYMLTDLR